MPESDKPAPKRRGSKLKPRLWARTYADTLDWKPIHSVAATHLIASAAGRQDDEISLSKITVVGFWTELPFYKQWKLFRLEIAEGAPAGGPPSERVYMLWGGEDRPKILDGDSAPIHEVNELEQLELGGEQAVDYIRFFLFALRADGQPFILFEQAPAKVTKDDATAAAEAMPLTPAGTDDEGRMLFRGAVVFGGDLFHATFAVPTDGEIEMVDDEPIKTDFPESLIPLPDDLTPGPLFAAQLRALVASDEPEDTTDAAVSTTLSPSATRTRRVRPTLVELVELVLERALLAQSQNRLLTYFNAHQPASGVIDQFARLMRSASPVVVIEGWIPFVEESVAQLINDTLPPAQGLPIYRPSIGQDGTGQEAIDHYSLPDSGPALALIPLLVYRRTSDMERLAFDLATRDIGAIISCERFSDLPESLRRNTDLTLRLPAIDEPIFEALFARVIGRQVPRRWKRGGTGWVKNVLSTDFEHPRRYKFSSTQAMNFVRAQVEDRLALVNPGHAMSLGDLQGMGEAREWAEDLIADIHAAMKGELAWPQVDHGVLLAGPPGTGKTTLAKAIAKDCGVKFIQGSAATWMAEGGTLGPHIQAIRKTFGEARTYSPSILFIDEIDSLGNREAFVGDNNSIYQTEVVNAVLEQMQGMDPSSPVVVIGATNNINNVDAALRRSGRLDRVITIPRPNAIALDRIFRYHIADLGGAVAVNRDVDTKVLGGLSVGLTGADVERIVRGALRRARKARRALSQADLVDELTNKPRGEGSWRMSRDELKRTAMHEAGHALAAFLSSSKGADIGFISIIPREDGTLGFVAPLPDQTTQKTRREYAELLETYLAGRAAEELAYGLDELTGGSSNDLHGATSVALMMVTQLGLGDDGHLAWSDSSTDADRSEASALLRAAYDRTRRNLAKHEEKLRRFADELVVRQEMSGDDARALLRRAR